MKEQKSLGQLENKQEDSRIKDDYITSNAGGINIALKIIRMDN
jgi:hypothetical protein